MDMHLYYFDQKNVKQMLERTGFKEVHSRNYCHIITFEYFLWKLDALGIPGTNALRQIVLTTPLSKIQIPFRFGDIRLYVSEKVRDLGVENAREAENVWVEGRPALPFASPAGQRSS